MRRLATLVIAISLAACGGSADEADDVPVTVEPYTTTVPPEGRSLASWQAATRAVCDHYDPLLQSMIDRYGILESQGEVIDYLDEALPIMGDYLDDLRSVPVPTERTREVNEIIDKLDRGETSLEVVRDGALSGSASKVFSSVALIQNYADTDELYRSLGVPECAADA